MNENLESPLDKNMETNVDQVKDIFSYGMNTDFSMREFTSNQKHVLFFYSSTVDTVKIENNIIKPLLFAQYKNDVHSIVTIEKIEEAYDFEDIAEGLINGKAILFREGDEKKAYVLDVSNFKHRNIEQSQNENLVKGPKEAFTESLNTNLSLIRKRIHDNDLIAEKVSVGKRSKSNVTVMYIKDLANGEVLGQVKSRIKRINTDSVRNIEILEQYIEDKPFSILPTLLYTERPDRAASYLEDGYIVLLMENSSACLILPVTFWSFFHSPEDRYLRFMFGNFARLIRFTAMFITMFISSIYITLTNFHSEMIPPDLLLAIASSREKVPFPVAFEVLIMEFAFELIREAGLRIPSPLGPTIGIVGALILGQAAVEANIISPIIVIVAALSGLSSFAIPDISFNYSVRITRFLFIFSSMLFGIFSLTGCFLLWVMYLISVKSFGVPYLSPLTPHFKSSNDTLLRKLIGNELWRPGNIRPKDMRKQ
ncbi:spore germination protein [Bacillus sp. Marseille-P3661]|uniref:spore germination protein n=1 Tax=Bacillus sp. Marseille-P3661 TaxID=1936234 RepID=UPI000C866D1E|nr:spore germination protein [Bacillus sp. Marseille-P3661]